MPIAIYAYSFRLCGTDRSGGVGRKVDVECQHLLLNTSPKSSVNHFFEHASPMGTTLSTLAP